MTTENVSSTRSAVQQPLENRTRARAETAKSDQRVAEKKASSERQEVDVRSEPRDPPSRGRLLDAKA